MNVFAEQYYSSYKKLRHRLTAQDRMTASHLRNAEKRLGIVAPDSLRHYYLVAGRERRFNNAFNRLLPPSEWFVDSGKLVFMDEQQAVVYWGVPATAEPVSDPPVYQGVSGEPICWYREHNQCSTFLIVMLYWQACFGSALSYGSTALVSVALRRKLRANWEFAGEVNRMQAFCRQGQAVCHLKWDDGWRVFCGAVNAELMESMVNELQLDCDPLT